MADRCPRCNGLLTINQDGDRVCVMCGCVLYAKRGFRLPEVRREKVRQEKRGRQQPRLG